uniref:Titin n=1 Tax=Kryptolebias marmoratus TaxID=37003 RepID=A0A3Q3GP70_KRYMA
KIKELTKDTQKQLPQPGWDRTAQMVTIIFVLPSLPAKPDEPKGPIRFDEIDATTVNCSWDPPVRDGGAPISGYVVEQRDAHRPGWVPVCDSVSRPMFRFENLIEGDEYVFQFKFRVMACNAGGSGEPAEVPGALKYKDLYVVRHGGVVRLSIPIKGKPLPTCKWLKDGGAVSTRAMIASTEDASELVIKGAERGESGLYELLLENKVGKKKAQIKVKVIGRPSAPEGPMIFEEIQANSVKVSWKPPTNDGGSEILGYIVERREAARNAWYTVDSRVTETQLIVKGLKEGTEYHFKVTAENSFGISGSLKSEQPLVPKTPLCKYYFFANSESKPSLRKEMDEVTAKLGQPAVMKCQIVGRPVPEIKWYHAGKEIVESRKYEMSSDGRNHSLSIMTDQQEDEGEYTCKAINDAGEAEATAHHAVCPT